ncbi:MAG: hypothetical protein U0838_04360 [Chloroflexota bacterium]
MTISTSKGNIVIKVDGSLSPIAAGNFGGARRVRLLQRRGVPPARARLRHPGRRRHLRPGAQG